MAAWIGPAIQAGGTLLGAIMGNRGANQAAEEATRVAEENNRIRELNLEFQKVAREQGIEFAQQMLAEGRLGVTDAQGNRTYFKPGQGWVTELSPMQQKISDRTEEEQLRQATDTASRVEGAEARNTRMAGTAEDMYNRSVNNIKTMERGDGGRLAQLLYRRAMGANNEVADAAQSAAMRRLIGTGNTTPGRLQAIFSGRAAEDRKSSRDAALESQLRAKEYNDAKYNTDMNRERSLLSQFGGQASYTPSMTLHKPTGPQSARGSDQTFGQQLISASRMAPQSDYESPNYGPANATIDVGQNIQSGLSSLAGWFNNQHSMEQLKEIFGKQ